MGSPERYVTTAECARVNERIFAQLTDIKNTGTDTNTKLDKICKDVYGEVQLGELKGGIIPILRDIRADAQGLKFDIKELKNHSPHDLSAKNRVAIIISLITSISAIVVAFIGR